MIGKLKALGLALVAVAAASAFSASTAQAGELDIGWTPASVFAHSEFGQDHVFTLRTTTANVFTARCGTASLEGTTQGQKINEATVTATYTGFAGGNCTAFGVNAQVLMNGCRYTLTGSGQFANTAVLDIVGCTSGKQIEIKTAICTLDIPQQNNLWHVVGSNLSSTEVTLSATVNGIQVRQTGAICPDGNNHVSSISSFTGNTILRARTDTGGFLVTKHSHQYTELNQTGINTTVAST